MAEIILAEVTCHDGTSQKTLRFATAGYVTGAVAGTLPANTYYDGRISQPGNTMRSIFGNRKTFGMTQVGYGELALVNPDGALDYLATYGFAGFPITIRRGVMAPTDSAPTWTTVLSGVMESADFSWKEVSIKVRDRQQQLGITLQQTRYGGTNTLPNGLDGVATDIKGKCLPILYGKAFNFSPPCVNTSRLIYQISDGTIQSVDQVFDNGALMTAGAAYTSQSDMETNAPASNQYRVWINSTGSYIRLGSTPSGAVTVDATHGANAAARTPAQLMNLVLLRAGVTAGDISSGDITALDALAPYTCGCWVGPDKEYTAIEVMDMLSNSGGAWWGVDRTGKFRMAQVVDPAGGTSIGTLTSVEIIEIDRVRAQDDGSGIPAWQVSLNYQRMATLSNNTGSGAAATVKSDRAAEYRQLVANDSSVKTKWPKAVEMTFDTVISNQTDAQTELTRRFNLYKVQRDTLTVTCRVDDALAALIDLGAVITVQVSRFSYSAGKKFLVTGIRTDLRNNIFYLTLWG